MGRLDGKTAIITGAGNGIGRAEAILFAREGCGVVVADLGCDLQGRGRDPQVARAVADNIRKAGGRALALCEDVADPAAAGRIIEEALQEFGRVDILVNTAGITRDRMAFNMDPRDFDAVVKVHLYGTFHMCQRACAHFREQHKAGKLAAGRILNTTSIVGLTGNIGQVNYAAAKAGIANMTVNLSREMSRYATTVNAISPVARTRMTLSSFGPDFHKPAPGQPDLHGPESIAPLAAFLASDEAQGITGRIFHIEGNRVEVMAGWSPARALEAPGAWTVDEIARRMPELLRGVPETKLYGEK